MATSFIIISILIAGAYANHIETFIHNQANRVFQKGSTAVYFPFKDGSITADRDRFVIQLDQVLQFEGTPKGQPTVMSVAKLHSKSWNTIVEQILIFDKHLRPKSCLSDGDIDKDLSGMTAESAKVAVDTLSSLIGLLGGKDKNVDLAVHHLAILLTSFATNPEKFLEMTDFPEDVPVATSVIPISVLVMETRQYISSHSAFYQQQFGNFFSDADVPITNRIMVKDLTKRNLQQEILREPDLYTLGFVLPPQGLVHFLCIRLVNTCRFKWGMSSHAAVNLVAYLSWYCEECEKCHKSDPNLATAPYRLKQNPSPSWHPAAPLPRSPSFVGQPLPLPVNAPVKLQSSPSSSNLHVKVPRSPRSPGSSQLSTKRSCPDTTHTYESFDDLVGNSPTDTVTVD
uniref:Uncharacterized protein n=1 Tax=Spongospora subterranea TaxID=70186 RepID=A0A0H5R949_9EUKA|eukprot:CRZ10653.1 hypothetical protein [Spongospora subterranea]